MVQDEKKSFIIRANGLGMTPCPFYLLKEGPFSLQEGFCNFDPKDLDYYTKFKAGLMHFASEVGAQKYLEEYRRDHACVLLDEFFVEPALVFPTHKETLLDKIKKKSQENSRSI